MQRHSFKGDQAAHLDKLIAASQRPDVNEAQIRERTLVPYFDMEVGGVAAFEPLQRHGSSPKKEHKVLQAKKKATPGPTPPTGQLSGEAQAPSRKHQRDPSAKNLQAMGSATQQQQNHQPKRQEVQRQKQPPRPPTAPKYAGPAFTNSPTPDALPLPSFGGLLLQ